MKRTDLLLSLAAVLSAGAYLTGNITPALIAAGIVGYYSMARLSFNPKIEVERRIPERGTELEPLKAGIRVRNLSKIPCRLRITEESEFVFARDVEVKLKPGETRALQQTIVPQRKGYIPLRAKVIFEDEPGFFYEELSLKEEKLLVLPSARSIREALKIKRQVEAIAEVEKALGIGLETLDFKELRDFRPGDDVRKIDWKSTSRLGELMVKEFYRETLSEIYLLINVDRKFRRELRNLKVDYLVLITAQLVEYFRRFGYMVNGVAYDEDKIVKLVPNPRSGKSFIGELKLAPQRGIPPIKAASLERESSLSRKILSLRRRVYTSGPVRAALKVEPNSYVVIVDDIGLHPREILKAVNILEKRGSTVVVLYPNPVFFVSKSDLNGERLELLYRRHMERKRLMKKLMGKAKIIEVGPKDLIPKVVGKL
ncbi:DUF58 domain-containing protein [Thermococcus atlanticus]